MKTYEFADHATSEWFFVEANTQEDAIKIANLYFDEPRCYGTVSLEVAEALGYDTY